MADMRWYKVWMVVPGTDGDAENGPCGPLWWNDMEQAPDEETAVRQADEKARRQWEEPNQYEPGWRRHRTGIWGRNARSVPGRWRSPMKNT